MKPSGVLPGDFTEFESLLFFEVFVELIGRINLPTLLAELLDVAERFTFGVKTGDAVNRGLRHNSFLLLVVDVLWFTITLAIYTRSFSNDTLATVLEVAL